MIITLTTRSRNQLMQDYLKSLGFSDTFINSYDAVSVAMDDTELADTKSKIAAAETLNVAVEKFVNAEVKE